jgi:hypothetical protein
MHIPPIFFMGLCLISVCSFVSASSLIIIAFEQSDKTALIPEAIIYADGVIAGKTDLNGEFNMSYEGDPPVIRVAKGGYSDWTGSPSVNDTALLVPLGIRNSSLNVEVYDGDTLNPIIGSQILVTGNDGIVHDGKTGSNGKSSIPLKADQVYNIRIQTRDFQPVNDTIVTTTDNNTVQYSLVRNDRISLRVTDSGTTSPIQMASITIDRQSAGVTNDRGILITNTSRNQEHVFEIEAGGYESVKQNRTISDLDKLIDFSMTEAKSVVFVSVYDENERPVTGAEIQVDGRSFGVTNEYGRLMIPGLEMKTHEFSAGMDGYTNASLSKTSGEETGEVILVLNKDHKNLVITVKDQSGSLLSNASVLISEKENQTNNLTTKADGTVTISLEKGLSPVVTAVKEGYYSNSTTLLSNSDNFTFFLKPLRSTVNVTTSVQNEGLVLPVIPILIIIALILVIFAGIVIIKKRPDSRRKRRMSRRRSL